MINVEEQTSRFAETINRQNEIIRQQSGIIDELSLLLMLHISADELSETRAYKNMLDVAEKIKGIEGGGTR